MTLSCTKVTSSLIKITSPFTKMTSSLTKIVLSTELEKKDKNGKETSRKLVTSKDGC